MSEGEYDGMSRSPMLKQVQSQEQCFVSSLAIDVSQRVRPLLLAGERKG
jgi:hypothetical protein